MSLSLTYAITSGQGRSHVRQNFTDIRTWAGGNITGADLAPAAEIADAQLASPINAAYRTLLTGSTPLSVADSGSGARLILSTGTRATSGESVTTAPVLLYFVSADYAVGSKTQKLRIRAQAMTNATAPAITFTAGLYPISASAGAAGLIAYTLGTVTTGSTAAIATPSASSQNQANSGDFTIPADGYYGLGVNLSGTPAANSVTAFAIQLQTRSV